MHSEQGPCRVTRNQAQEQEGDDDDANQHRDREQDPPDDIARGGACRQTLARADVRLAGGAEARPVVRGRRPVVAELGSAA